MHSVFAPILHYNFGYEFLEPTDEEVVAALVGNDPSRPTGGSVRKGVPDLGPGGPRAPMGAAQRNFFEHLRGIEAIF